MNLRVILIAVYGIIIVCRGIDAEPPMGFITHRELYPFYLNFRFIPRETPFHFKPPVLRCFVISKKIISVFYLLSLKSGTITRILIPGGVHPRRKCD